MEAVDAVIEIREFLSLFYQVCPGSNEEYI